MRKVSKKQAKRERLYSKQRGPFLEDNPNCAMKVDERCLGYANTVQHTKGRVGYADDWARDNDIWLINDVRFFLPACWPCHKYAEEHPNEAKEKGWAVSRLAKGDVSPYTAEIIKSTDPTLRIETTENGFLLTNKR